MSFNTDFIQLCIWYISFAVGVFFCIYGILFLLVRKGVHEEDYVKASVLEFIAGWVMYIPQELFNEIPASHPFVKFLEGILTALLRTLNMYWGNGYERVEIIGHPVFTGVYAIARVLANITLLIFLAGFIMKFLDGPVQRLKVTCLGKRYTYIFADCNERTLTIAESISQKKVNIIFANVDRKTDANSKQRINDIKGIYVDTPALSLYQQVSGRAKGIEVFLFGDSEEENLVHLESLCEDLKGKRIAPTKIFVELTDTPWDLYKSFLEENATDEERLIINFVRTDENFVYNNLLKNSIFENARPQENGDEKVIKFLLVGMNERTMEMLKAVLHLGQMPGYRLCVMILDNGSKKNTMCECLPDIKDECDKVGDALYKIIYHENLNLESNALDEIIANEYSDFSFAFVDAGSDLTNVNIAMRLKAICARKLRMDGYKIQVNVANQRMCKDWNKDLTENLEFVGDVKSVYNYGFITMSDIEKGSIAIHNVRYPAGTDRYKSWVSYCNNEYNRHSVYARTLSFKYKVKLISEMISGEDDWNKYKVTLQDKMWKIYEHMRWNMYTRTMGYVPAKPEHLDADGELSKKVRTIAKVHNDLVDFSRLSFEEQEKDALELTPEIVEILKSI